MRASQAHGDSAPGDHEECNPSRRFQALEHVVRGHFEEGVGDEEDHEGERVFVIGHVGLGEELARRSVDSRRADRGRMYIISRVLIEDFGVADVAVKNVSEIQTAVSDVGSCLRSR